MFRKILILSGLLFVMSSCNNDVTKKLVPKGAALGKLNEIVVIADEIDWEGEIGDTFRFYFQSAYPILPAPEPVFDLRHFTPLQLDGQPLRKELRTYAILADLSNEESPTTQMVKRDMGSEKFRAAVESGKPNSSIGKDKWAQGQMLVYLFGKNKPALFQSIKNNFPAVAKRINSHDSKQLESAVYFDKANMGMTRMISERFGIEMLVPGKYQIAVNDTFNNMVWLRKDTRDAILNVVFKKVPYNDESQLSKENIIAMRNEFGATYITSDTEGSVMVTNEEDLPVYEYAFKIEGQYGKELRGIWEMTADFKGGPFATYVVIDKDQKSLIYIDAFILAEGAKKRDKMMRLDYMIKTSKFSTPS